MPQTIQTLLTQYLSEVQKIYGAHLKSVILYGSYARGDYSSDSDVDIMLLVDLTPEEMDPYSDALSELGYEYNVNYDIWMMPVVKTFSILSNGQQHIRFIPMYRKKGCFYMKQPDSLDVGTKWMWSVIV